MGHVMKTVPETLDEMALRVGPMAALEINSGIVAEIAWSARPERERGEARESAIHGGEWSPFPVEPCPDCDRVGCGPVCPQQGVA